MSISVRGHVLLTGATGFVGRHVAAALSATDWQVTRASRNRELASLESWRYLDVEDEATIGPALEGCDAAIYLIHSIDNSDDYPEREARAASAFARAAASAGLEQIVYLGGVAPTGSISRHLMSRLRTGELLRAGAVSTIELRSGLIVGAGGTSWVMVRDLAARLPAMLLPRWLRFASWPVGIEDIATAIVRSLDLPTTQSAWYDVPGPERITHAELLTRVASRMGKSPRLYGVPVVTPRLSAYWIALVTRVDLALARELVEGLQSDLEPSGNLIWDALDDERPSDLNLSIDQALRDDGLRDVPSDEVKQRLKERIRAAQ